MAANSTYQYEQPRCPDNWTESERRFYTRLIEVLDDIYSKYGRINEKMLSPDVINKIETTTETTLQQMVVDILSAEKIAADSVEAAFAYLMALTCRYGNFEFADIKNLVADAMILEKGIAGELTIENLLVSFAQMASATINELCIKASDGLYYQLDVDEFGNVTAMQTDVADSEIEAGVTEGGRVLLETSILVEDLTTSNLMATYALINKIDAVRIDVDQLFAREAFITALTTGKIFANNSTLEIIAEISENVRKWFTFGEEGFVVQKNGIRWRTITDEQGYRIIADGEPYPAGSFQAEGLQTVGVSMGDITCKRTATGGWVWTDAVQGGE